MEIHVLFFIISCIAANALNFINAESSDLYLIKNDDKLWCAARGETAYSALSWTSTDNSAFSETNFSSWDSHLGCNLARNPQCQSWSGWKQVNSEEYHMPSVLDYRWNDFKLIRTDGTPTFSQENSFPIQFQNSAWEVTISITAAKDAYILLCEDPDPNNKNSNCYWIILGGWQQDSNKGCAIRRCPDGVKTPSNDCKNVIAEYPGKVVRGGIWVHVTLKLRKIKYTLQLDVLNKNVPFLYYNDKNPLNMKYLNVRSDKGAAYFRIHKYNYFLGKEGDELKSNLFIPESTVQCLSIVYSFTGITEDAALNVEVQYENSEEKKPVRTLKQTEGSWKHKKFNFSIKEDAFREISLIIKGKGSDRFAVGGIQQCNPNGDTRTSAVFSRYSSIVTCQALNNKDVSVNYTGQIDEYKDCENCTVTCKQFGIRDFESKQNCFSTTLCKNVENRSICFCSSGYNGRDCTESCHGSYGVNCNHKCGHCNSCDPENGTCSEGCDDYLYRPPYCQKEYLTFVKAPELHKSTFTSISVIISDSSTNGDGIASVYRLQYKLASQIEQENEWTTVGTYSSTSTNVIDVKDLKSATEYAFRAVITDKEGGKYEGEKIPYSNYTTDCSDPEDIRVQAFREGISLNWMITEYACPLKNYVLKIEKDGELIHTDKSISLPLNVSHLNPFTNYSWRIESTNHKTIKENNVETLEGVPDPPVNLKTIDVSARRVKLHWERPDIVRGKLRKFEAKIMSVESGLSKKYNKVKEKTVNEFETKYELEVNDLYPASKYQVEIYGITVEPGTSSTVYYTTPVSVPDIGSHLYIDSGSVTNTTVQIRMPDTDQFLTKDSVYILIVTAEYEIPDNKLLFSIEDTGVKNNVLKQADIKHDGKSWIAGEIKPTGIKEFKIGDDKTYNLHFVKSTRNHPLIPGSLYQVTLVAVNVWRNTYEYSAIKLEKPIQTLETYGDDTNAAAWVIPILIILCIPLLIFWFIKRRRTSGKQERSTLELKQPNDSVIVVDTPSMIEPESHESKLPPSQRFSLRVAISDLAEYVKTGLKSGELQRQHELFPRGQTRPWDYGKLPENKTKNRYGNLVAYDETRVKLKKIPGDQFSDYINANYINGYNSSKFYIATQGPKRNTVVDFWRMIWQEHVQVIVMLANIIEDTKVKCEKYWPEFGQEVTHGTVTILNASNQIFADFTFRQFNVSCKGKTRKVHHLHFTSWPDHGVPMYPQSLASFLKKLLATSPGSGPIIVHCSAGVGRTGSVILSDICLRMAAAEGYVDMLSFLQQIREQRANMVDNLDQYKLVHLVLLECLVTEPSSYPCDANFEKRVEELSSSGTIKHQFSHLHDIRWQDEALRPAVGGTVLSATDTDKSKNRNLDIVPGPNGRVYISSFPYDEPNSDYINAVYVDGFRVKDQFIATQFPLESTICDFWRLIAEKKISLIVVLNEIENQDKSVCQFWPSESMNPVPHIKVNKKQEHHSNYWKIYDINITTVDTEEESRTVHILHLKDWRSDEKLPPSTSVILELWQESERLYTGSEPILVTCLDGATACGYFVALAFLIEKIKLEQQCDVCQAVRTVRQNREQFIVSCDQFEYLYKAAVTYLESFQLYANFS